MSIRLASTQLLAPGILLSRYAGHGVRGDAIPATGTHGPAPLYAWLTLPADAANEYRWAVTTPPTVGDLVIFEDGGYSYTPPPGTTDLLESFDFEGWENGTLLGSATYTIAIGSTGVTLSVADAAHGHSADNITLAASGSTSLTVADAAHGHAVGGLTLTAASVLAIQEALHAHVADVLALASAHSLVLAEATHGHAVGGLTLTAASVLAIQEALHAHGVAGLTLEGTGSTVLSLADGLHAHGSDGLSLVVDAWLVLASALSAHSTDNVVFTFGGALPTESLPLLVPLQGSYMLVAPERSLMIVRV